jgi:hypothetical protein
VSEIDLYEEIKGDRGRIESFIGQVPGYKGYKEKEMRREADKILRDALSRRLEEQWRRLPDIQKQLLKAGQIEWLDDIESATMKLQTLIDRIKTATYGYAGLFDAVRVKEEELDQLYNFDMALTEEVDQITGAIDQLETSVMDKDGIGEAIAQLNATVTAANETFGRRRDVITRTATI